MLKRITLLLGVLLFGLSTIWLFPAIPYVQNVNVTQIRFYSHSLKKEMNLAVYLPPGYSNNKKYPVLYLLPGYDANENSWMNGYFGFHGINVNALADQIIRSGQIRPSIIVSPQLDNSYGINTSLKTGSINGYGRGMYQDYLMENVIPYIDHHYSVSKARKNQFIGGFSMGGFAALHDAFLYPTKFSKVGVMSAALWVEPLPAVLTWIYPTNSLKRARDPIELAQERPLRGLSVEIIEGKSDPFVQADEVLSSVLKKIGVHLTYSEYPGGHTYSFWRSHAAQLLLYFAGKRRIV